MTLKGSYGIGGSGSIVQPPGTPFTGPFVRAGLASFDGKGTVEFNTTSSYNGFIFSEPFKGTYLVRPDCTVTVVADLPPPASLTATFHEVISDQGGQVDYLLTNHPGTTIVATLLRRPKGRCQTRDLYGSDALRATGVVLGASPLAGQFPALRNPEGFE